MKTTLMIDDRVMARLRERATREGTTISRLVEAALRRFLDADEDPRLPRALPPLPGFHGRGFLVDITDRDALYEEMERR